MHYVSELDKDLVIKKCNDKSPWNPSKKAIARVLNPLPIPSECPHCNGHVEITLNRVIYGVDYGDWPWVYHCVECHAIASMHPFTAIPMSKMAGKDLRKAREKAKKYFHTLEECLGRRQAYAWLAGKMNMPVAECHFGWFDLDQCEKAGEICEREARQAKPHMFV